MRSRSLALLALLLCICSMMFAQVTTGDMRGTVTDPNGAVVQGATVTITNTDTGQVVRTVKTNASGQYAAPLLEVSTYSVTVEAAGFKKYVQSGIPLNVADRLTVDAKLTTGAASDTVNVEAEAVQVNTQNAQAEGLISGVQVRELPLNNRNYEQLVLLQPGVTSSTADSIFVGTTNPSGGVNIVPFSISGNRSTQNNWTIDGADNLDHGSNLTLLVYPSVDAISEFKILRGNYNAEFGRSASGQIDVITRSGTRNFHGSAYEFFRNEDLNANNAFNKQVGLHRNVLRYNDFGGTIGGPLFIPGIYPKEKTKTFFFFSEELRRITTPVQETAVVPTAAERAGQFPVAVCNAIDAAGNCTGTGTSIAAGNISPIAAAYLKDVFAKVPLPNLPGGLLRTTSPGLFNFQEEVYRIDHNLTDKIALAGRFINDHIPTTEPFGLFGPQSTLPNVANTKTNSPGRQWFAKATVAFTPTLLNEVGYAYSYGAIISDPTGALNSVNSPDVVAATKLPFPVTLHRIPNLIFDDNFDSLFGFGQYRDYNRNHNLFDNLTWVVGNHSMKFGFTWNKYQKKENAAGDNSGNIEFDSTNDPGNAGFEQDWANFLLGYASSDFSQAPNDLTADIRQNLYEGYAQDEWRIKSNLTLSFGLRYSYFQTPTGGDLKNLTTFDPARYSAASAPQLTSSGRLVLGTGNAFNGIITGAVNSPFGSYITRQDKTDFAPRVGIAWDPFKNGKTSIRSGYGVFYDSVAAGIIEDNVFNNPPFLNTADFGGVVLATAANSTALTSNIPPGLWTTAPNWNTPYTQQWDLDIQQDFGRGWIGDVGYFGNKGTHLPGVVDINQVKPGAAQAAGFVAPGAVYSGGSSAQRKLNLLRPYQGYAQIAQIAPIFDSNYNSLQTQLIKRFSGGNTVSGTYTWSKGLTDNQTDRSTGLLYTYCKRCEYGRTQLDRRNVGTVNYVYNLPFMRAQDGFLGRMLGGWELSGILVANSGLPITPFELRGFGDVVAAGVSGPGAPNNGRVATPRPTQIADPNSNAPHKQAQWFNTSAFVAPTANDPTVTARRGAINGPGFWRYDQSLMKNFKIYESLNLTFRAEAFNLFNHTNYNSVGATLGSATYGKVLSVRDPRILQLSLKLQF